MKTRKFIRQVEAEKFTYATLHHATEFQVKRLREMLSNHEEGTLLIGMVVVVFSAFTIEAHLNHLIKKLSCRRSDLWESPSDKLEIVCKKLNFSPDRNERPFASFVVLFDVRNALAHGQTEEINKIQKLVEVNKKAPKVRFPDVNWENGCKPRSAIRLFGDMVKIVKDLHARAGQGDHPFLFAQAASFGDTY